MTVRVFNLEVYLYLDEAVQGPFSPGELSELWRAGHVNANAYYWHRGMSAWAPTSEYKAPLDPRTPADAVQLTTAERLIDREIEIEIDILAADSIVELESLGDSRSSIRRAHRKCLEALRGEAFNIGADAVLAVRLQFTALDGLTRMAAVATGTGVRLYPPAPPG